LTSTSSAAWSVFADLLDPPENPYVREPVGWVRDRLGEFLWSKQREILEAVVHHRYVAVKSAHDTGKSHGASRAVAWWLDTRDDPFATTTAPTTKQVHAILWRYIGQAHRKGNLPGRITLDDEWYMGPGGKELVAFGRKPADHDQSAFQGIHALNPLILVDEACGVPKSIFDAVDALAINSNARVLAIGNPDDPSSHFAQICKPGSGWHVITVSAFDTPAYTGEKVPEELLPLLVSPEWVEERKIRWGVTSPIYQSKVLGEFPDVSDDTLIQPKWIEAAQKRTLERTRRPIVAADIARFGEDETVIMRREGGWVRTYRAPEADTMATAGHIAKAMRDIDDEADKNDWVTAVIDVPGVGGGVVDRLIELDLPVTPYNGGEAPIDKERFVNARAEDYWSLRERFEQGEIDIDPDHDKLAAQLGSFKWTVDSRGRIKIESKDDMRKRGLPSPDRADTVAMAFSARAQGGSNVDVGSHAGGSITGDLMTKQW
jgi:hypothetical protein